MTSPYTSFFVIIWAEPSTNRPNHAVYMTNSRCYSKFIGFRCNIFGPQSTAEERMAHGQNSPIRGIQHRKNWNRTADRRLLLLLTSLSLCLSPVTKTPKLVSMASSGSNTSTITFPIFITTESLHSILSHQTLINHFHSSLPTVSASLCSPIRQSYAVSPTSSLLLMPSWSSSPSLPYVGVKLVTYFPQNSTVNLPGIHGSYVLFSSTTGQTLATMDGTALTLYRTASVSGLASKILSRNDSRVLVMIGAGALAPHLIRAHLAARPGLKRVIIWNRTEEKARALAEEMRGSSVGVGVGVWFESNACLDEAVGMGDIVSCATNSEVALVKGERLKVGAHLDLVGSFKHSMKECDDEAIRRGRVFVDNETALVEAGELVGAFERGVIDKAHVCGMLVELIGGQKVGRTSSDEITVFKSVGSAVVDILAAQLLYETYMKQSDSFIDPC